MGDEEERRRAASEHARRLVRLRWDRDTQGLDTHIDKLVSRAPALTPEHWARIRALLDLEPAPSTEPPRPLLEPIRSLREGEE